MANLTGNYEVVMVYSVANGSEAVQALSDKFLGLITCFHYPSASWKSSTGYRLS